MWYQVQLQGKAIQLLIVNLLVYKLYIYD